MKTIFIPVQFYPPDLTGNNNLPITKKLIFRERDSVVLTAPVKYEGKKFLNWQIKSNDNVLTESFDNPLTIIIESNLTVFAIYDGLSITSWPNITIGPEPNNINTFTITSWPNITIGPEPNNINTFTITSWPNITIGPEPNNNSISKINSFVKLTSI